MPKKMAAVTQLSYCIDCGKPFAASKTKISPRCAAHRLELQKVRRQHDRDLEKARQRAQDKLRGEYQQYAAGPDLVAFAEKRDIQLAAIENLMSDGISGSNGSDWREAEDPEDWLPADDKGRVVLYSSSTGLKLPDMEVKSPKLPLGAMRGAGVSTTDKTLQGELLERAKRAAAHPWYQVDHPLWQYLTIAELKEQFAAELAEARQVPEPAFTDEIAARSAKAGLMARERHNGGVAA